MNPIEQLMSVLCDPEGKCCIAGSDEDCAIIDRALKALAEPAPVQEPVAWVNQANLASASIERTRCGQGDTHTWSETRTTYHSVPLYTAPQAQQPAVEPTCKPSLQVHKPTGWAAPNDQYAVPVLFNPYSGEPRDVRDVQSDPQGVLIVPPGKVHMLAAPKSQPTVEPDAFLHDDGCWTTAKTDAGRAMNERLHFAGSTKVAVYTAPQAPQPSPPADVPMLTEDEIVVALHVALPSLSYDSEDAFISGVRAGEQAVRQKAGLP